jgi:hypothetical protein
LHYVTFLIDSLRKAKDQESKAMTNKTHTWGFSPTAEAWNGRLAMVGIVLAVVTELLTGESILGQLGAFLPF